MKIRELAPGDVEALYALRMHRYQEIQSDPAYGMGTVASPPTLDEFTPWFASLYQSLRDGTGVCTVATEAGRIVGMARIVLESDALETRHVGVLSIEVLPENAAGQRLYRKFGFIEYGRLPRGFQRGGAYHDFVLMHRAVAPPESR